MTNLSLPYFDAAILSTFETAANERHEFIIETDGTPLTDKQTAAHELGHLFGLGHAPRHAINLMAPHGCALCRFSEGQCRALLNGVVPELSGPALSHLTNG